VAGEFLDTGTQTGVGVRMEVHGNLNMHMCRSGSFMVGVNIGENYFLCNDDFGLLGTAYKPSDLEPNYDPQKGGRYTSHSMAACPPGKAMVGLHVGKNVLLCAPLKMRDLFVDASTRRVGMHACPEGSVMVGIHAGCNLLLCGRVR
jgi:hypothetical protein